MLKRILPLALALCMLTMAGCKKEQDRLSVDKGSEPSVVSETKPVTYKNPLTGVSGISEEKTKNRPVAVMINNISTAQPVQTGLNKADIIYETEVEGGITRLMAVFQDITTAEKIGAIRSARYPYVDLAMGHNAIYIHCGQDNKYGHPHRETLESLSERNCKILRTDTDGTVAVTTDGNTYSVYTWSAENGLSPAA